MADQSINLERDAIVCCLREFLVSIARWHNPRKSPSRCHHLAATLGGRRSNRGLFLRKEPARRATRGLTERCTRGLNGRIHEHWIVRFERVIGPRRDHETRIRSCLELGWRMEFLETARQEKQCWAVFARVGVGTQRNKESQAAQASVAHCLGSGASPHRMA